MEGIDERPQLGGLRHPLVHGGERKAGEDERAARVQVVKLKAESILEPEHAPGIRGVHAQHMQPLVDVLGIGKKRL